MKLTIVLMSFSFSLMHAASTYGQSTMLSLDITNMPVQNVLDEIESQSEFSFFYNNKQLNTKRIVTLKKQNTNVFAVLDELFANTNVAYSVLDKSIILTTRENKLSTVQQAGKRITGVVVDEKGETIIGANVIEKGTTNGTVTDLNGNFSLQVTSNATLQISYIGYLPQEIQVGNQTNLRITLREDTKALEEVVVVAYGTQKSRSVTGAISKINTHELVDIPVSNITQKMQGKFAGVQIINNNAEPNGNMSIRIRGQASINGGNSPLIVIDGFPSTTGLESLSPDEIESISILKDAASASLYGSRAANGVILVTTKQGQNGKTNISLSANYGFENVSDRGKPDVMNAQEFAQFKKEYYEDAQKYEGSTTAVPEQYANPSAVKDGTNWFDVLLRTGHTQNYNLGLTTGTEVVKSAVNLNYNRVDGVILETFAERFTARSNNEFKASEKIKFGLNLSGSYIRRQVQTGLGYDRNIIGSSFLMDPQLKYKNDDGTYPISFSQPGMFANPNFYLVLKDRKNPSRVIRGTMNAFTEVEFIEGLKYRLNANADMANFRQETWVPSHVNGAMFSAPPNPSYGSYYNFNYQTWLLENLLTYSKTFFYLHDVDVLLGYSAQQSKYMNSTINASDYPDDEVGFFNAATTKVGSGSKSQWSMASWFARLNYAYNDRYLLTLAFRRDGCSRFGMNARWANFPSVSAGWIVTEEDFMKQWENLNFLKLRASWGKVGNNNLGGGDYPSIASVSSNNYVYNGTVVPGRQLSSIANGDLTWETTESWDIGLDVGLFNDRIFFMYDYYRKTTDGLLYWIDIPYASGFSNILSNIGEFRFWGHELTLQTKNMVGKFKWSTDLNISFDRNKAIKLGTNNTPIGGYNNQVDYNRTEVGKPLGRFFGYVYDGVYMTQAEYDSQPKHDTSTLGTVRMKDINGDGVINTNDKTYIGDPNPDFLYGITNSFSWNRIDASFVLSGSVGNDILDATYEWTENIDGVFNVRKCVADRWRSEENPGKGEIPRTLTGTTELFRYTNSRWVYDGSYMMLKNLTVGYTVPLKKNPYVRSLRFYVSGQNLFTITNYPGMNPEVSRDGTNGLYSGVDHTAYPVSRVYTFGLNVLF